MESSKQKTVKAFGHWPSPITAEYLSGSTVQINEVAINETSGATYWIESRPGEDGRCTIMEHSEKGVREILPSEYSAHATVVAMTGGSFAVSSSGLIVFSDDNTQNVYRMDPESREVTVVQKAEKYIRYGDYTIHPKQENWIVATKEDHREATPTTMAYGVHDTLVALDAASSKEHTLASGDDFYAYARFNHDGTQLAWIQWSHPDMPWTGSTLWIADWADGSLKNVTQIAGEKLKKSVSQPRWAADGTLFFVSDRSGYWQIWTYDPKTKETASLSIPGLETAEFAIADWELASSTYIILDSKTIVASCVTNATSNIMRIDIPTKTYQDMELPFVDLGDGRAGVFGVSADSFVVLGSTRNAAKSLTLVSNVHSTTPNLSNLQPDTGNDFDSSLFSTSQYMQAPRTSRPGVVHMFYFPPHNPGFEGPPNALPPVLIHVHGGPNACNTPKLALPTQYWTSRGFAVCEVNYSGSTGFRREYREELTGYWGLYDIEDTRDAAEFLKSQGLVDPARVGVYGGSAGGYVTLSAIHMFPSTFQAAVSSYGISDVRALQADSWKVESHDVERLILSSCDRNDTEARDRLYRERSPRYHVANITAPLLILQGTDDLAVPKEQSYMMVEEMKRLGRTVKIVEFEGEGHGWMREDTILRALKEEEAWWKAHLT